MMTTKCEESRGKLLGIFRGLEKNQFMRQALRKQCVLSSCHSICMTFKCWYFTIFFALCGMGFVAKAEDLGTIFGVDFFESMSPAVEDRLSLIKQDAQWLYVKNLYDIFIKNNLFYIAEPRIPKIVHQIWLGSPFPEKYREFQKTWILHHPDWEYKLWTDEDIRKLGLVNQVAYDRSRNYGQKSDIARYEILYRFGGVYVDTDFKCIRAFDVFHHCLEFYIGTGFDQKLCLFNGLMGAAPGHPILKSCIDNLFISGSTDATTIMTETGPYYIARHFLNYVGANPSKLCVAFPAGYFYPWPAKYRFDDNPTLIEKWIRPETFAIHYWHVSWNK